MAHEQAPNPQRPDFTKLDINPHLSLPDVKYFADILGAGSLPKMKDGKIAYLKANLGIDLSTYPKPRLMADVMIDLITLCQVMTHELQPKELALELLTPFNTRMRLRHVTGQPMETTLRSGKTLRQASLDWNYAPGNNADPLKPGAYKSILETLESALLAKSASTESSDTDS